MNYLLFAGPYPNIFLRIRLDLFVCMMPKLTVLSEIASPITYNYQSIRSRFLPFEFNYHAVEIIVQRVFSFGLKVSP